MSKARTPVDEDASRDPAHAEIFALLGSGAATSEPPAAPRRRAARKQPGPDTNMGLAEYFNNRCPQPSWAHGMQLNSMRGLAGMFREMREHGLTADAIRALIDLYFSRLGNRVPRSAYWLDFKGSRWRLLRALEEGGSARTEADYDGWTAQPAQPSTDGFAGWQ